jgi:hypothetical protein
VTVYRSPSVTAFVAAARDQLDDHTGDPATGRCVRCGGYSPCLAASDAANLLAELDPPAAPLLTTVWRRRFARAAAGSRAANAPRRW